MLWRTALCASTRSPGPEAAGRRWGRGDREAASHKLQAVSQELRVEPPASTLLPAAGGGEGGWPMGERGRVAGSGQRSDDRNLEPGPQIAQIPQMQQRRRRLRRGGMGGCLDEWMSGWRNVTPSNLEPRTSPPPAKRAASCRCPLPTSPASSPRPSNLVPRTSPLHGLSGGTFLEENRFPQTPSKDLWVGGTV